MFLKWTSKQNQAQSIFFLAGFTMFKTLTRNAFAQVQSKIFPMYFMTGIILGAISLLSHIYINHVKFRAVDTISIYQVGLINK